MFTGLKNHKRMMKMKKITAILICMVMMFAATSAIAAPSEWAAAEVDKAIQTGLVTAILQKEYQKEVTREEFCSLAIRFYAQIASIPQEEGENPFTDTDNPDVILAAHLGIVNGVGEGIFAPVAPVTRQEMCTMLVRAVDRGLSHECDLVYEGTYPDADKIADWAKPAVDFMHAHGAIKGDENGKINPLGNTTREQAMLFSVRLYEKLQAEVWGKIAEGLLGM